MGGWFVATKMSPLGGFVKNEKHDILIKGIFLVTTTPAPPLKGGEFLGDFLGEFLP